MSATTSEFDERFMRRAIRLAMNGRGLVEPNPMVGCVLVKGGRVIGEGYHAKFGGPHAEPAALASCTESPEGATAYVTLEPCCHTNKKTPPCVPALFNAKIARVVVGCLDPNPDVNGKGLHQLREAGVEVIGPVLEAEAKQLIAPFLLRICGERPYVTLKWAQSSDGKVAGAAGQPRQITGPDATRLVHELRARSGGILVGVNTVLTDDPLLNARHASIQRHPSRFILDRTLRTPPNNRIVIDDSGSTTIFCGHDTSEGFRRRRDALAEAGVTVTTNPLDGDAMALDGVLSRIKGMFVNELLVEPGPTLAAGFFKSGLVDRVWIFRATAKIVDQTAPAAACVPSEYVRTGELDVSGDPLTEYLNPASPVFFAAVPSADFVLAREGLVPSPRIRGEG